MAVNPANVLVGAPDQATTGAIQSAPIGTDLPDVPSDALDPAFAGSGYVDEEGVTLNPSRSTTPIRDWSLSVVRQVLTEFDGTIAWTHLEVSEEALKTYFGDDQVTVTPATESSGKITRAELKAVNLGRKSWVYRMKDGLNRALIVVPDGEITEQGEISLVAGDAIKLPVTLTAYPDSDGTYLYVVFDDGQVLEV